MVGLQSLDLPIGVRIPVSQPNFSGQWPVVSGSVEVGSLTTDHCSLATFYGLA